MVFILSALWWRRIRGLWKLLDGREWLRGKLGFILMGVVMPSKFLIQFSIDGWSCVPSLLFTWCQTMVEVMKIMVSSFKRSHACMLHSVPQSCSRPPLIHSFTGDSWTLTSKLWVSLPWDHCSLLLGPCAQGSVCSLQESFSQSCVSSGSSMVG